MKATILHDEHGAIIAIAKVGDLKKAGSKFASIAMIPRPGHRLLEIKFSAELEKKPLPELHKEYRVDIASSKLVKKTHA
ncbi:MAG: hypothetical protein WBQ43_16235 [Terriglobales bacterium]